MKKSLFFILFLCFTLIFTTACTPSPAHYKVGTWKTAQTIQPFFYEKYIPEGQTIEVLPFTGAGDQKVALLGGDIDLCGSNWPTAIIAASKGEPIRIVAGMTNKCAALVVGKNSGIEKPEDLKGKTIAYLPGSIHHILLFETLLRAGLDPNKDVTLQRVDFFDMGTALSSGSVDAFCSGEPFPTMAVMQGFGRILAYPYYEDTFGYINAPIITGEKKIKENPEGIQALVTAHVEATKYLQENPEAWIAKAASFGVDEKIVRESTKNIELIYEITPEMMAQVNNLAKRMKELGIIETVPDMEAYLDLQFLEKAL